MMNDRGVYRTHSISCKRRPVGSTNNINFGQQNVAYPCGTGCYATSNVVGRQGVVSLEKVLGITLQSNCGLACDNQRGLVAYPAGCVVVLLDVRTGRQTFLVNSCRKAITALVFHKDGRHLATGESGHQPMVRVWDVEERCQVAEFAGHKFGVSCVSFSPSSGKYLVSIGWQHDMTVCVWDWRQRTQLSGNKVSARINGLAFSEDDSCFVTVGSRLVRFWYLDSSKAKMKETIPLIGRNGILGELRDNNFTATQCGRGSCALWAYAVTQSGQLCQFLLSTRRLERYVDLRSQGGAALAITENYLFVGCSNGIIRAFCAESLQFVGTVARPHALGTDIALASSNGVGSRGGLPSPESGSRFPDCVALCCCDSNRLTAVYNDHSLYVWDVSDIARSRVGKLHSFLFHSGCVWDVTTWPSSSNESGVRYRHNLLPANSFATCSADDTVRLWNVLSTALPNRKDVYDDSGERSVHLQRNIFSQDLLKVLYTDPDYVYLRDVSINQTNSIGSVDKALINNSNQSENVKVGVRTLLFSPDGGHLATGDRQGNLRVYSMDCFEELCHIEAHDGEILCLDYLISEHDVSAEGGGTSCLFASTSRDRLIHVFEVSLATGEYNLLQSLDDHSAAVYACRFVNTRCGKTRILSCGADKSLLWRFMDATGQLHEATAAAGGGGSNQISGGFRLERHLVGRCSHTDMELHPGGKFVAVTGQDRLIRVYNVENGKLRKTYRGTLAEDGGLIKCALDPSGSYLAVASADKSVAVVDFFSGEVLFSLTGHSEVVLGVTWLADLRHLITVAGDSCILVWRLPHEMYLRMKQRMAVLLNSKDDRSQQDGHGQQRNCRGGSVDVQSPDSPLRYSNSSQANSCSKFGIAPSEAGSLDTGLKRLESHYGNDLDTVKSANPNDCVDHFRFSVTGLPSWAQKKMSRDPSLLLDIMPAASVPNVSVKRSYDSKDQPSDEVVEDDDDDEFAATSGNDSILDMNCMDECGTSSIEEPDEFPSCEAETLYSELVDCLEDVAYPVFAVSDSSMNCDTPSEMERKILITDEGDDIEEVFQDPNDVFNHSFHLEDNFSERENSAFAGGASGRQSCSSKFLTRQNISGFHSNGGAILMSTSLTGIFPMGSSSNLGGVFRAARKNTHFAPSVLGNEKSPIKTTGSTAVHKKRSSSAGPPSKSSSSCIPVNVPAVSTTRNTEKRNDAFSRNAEATKRRLQQTTLESTSSSTSRRRSTAEDNRRMPAASRVSLKRAESMRFRTTTTTPSSVVADTSRKLVVSERSRSTLSLTGVGSNSTRSRPAYAEPTLSWSRRAAGPDAAEKFGGSGMLKTPSMSSLLSSDADDFAPVEIEKESPRARSGSATAAGRARWDRRVAMRQSCPVDVGDLAEARRLLKEREAATNASISESFDRDSLSGAVEDEDRSTLQTSPSSETLAITPSASTTVNCLDISATREHVIDAEEDSKSHLTVTMAELDSRTILKPFQELPEPRRAQSSTTCPESAMKPVANIINSILPPNRRATSTAAAASDNKLSLISTSRVLRQQSSASNSSPQLENSLLRVVNALEDSLLFARRLPDPAPQPSAECEKLIERAQDLLCTLKMRTNLTNALVKDTSATMSTGELHMPDAILRNLAERIVQEVRQVTLEATLSSSHSQAQQIVAEPDFQM